MKVLIIEDEERGFSRLKRLLQNIDNSMEIQGPLTTMRAVIDYLQNPHDEDVIFADIRLGDGDVFEAFLEIAPTSPVIFTRLIMNMPWKHSRAMASPIFRNRYWQKNWRKL